MTTHDDFEERLSDYVDGELSAGEQRAVAAHLAECASCRETVEGLESVVRTARALVAKEPSADLWGGIAARMEPRTRATTTLADRRIAFSFPQLAAASVLLAALSGWAAMQWVGPRAGTSAPALATAASHTPADTADSSLNDRDRAVPASFDDVEYDAAVADLKTALEKGRGSLEPTTVLIIEENLNTINRAVDEARRALADDPANGFLSGYLVDTRRRQLDMLRQAAVLANRAD